MFLYHIRPLKYVKYTDKMTNEKPFGLSSSNDLFQNCGKYLPRFFHKTPLFRIFVEQNCLSLSNTLQSRYYIQGLCVGHHFLNVASRDPSRGRNRATHALLENKGSYKHKCKNISIEMLKGYTAKNYRYTIICMGSQATVITCCSSCWCCLDG